MRQVHDGLCGHTLARAHACSDDRVTIPAHPGSGERFDSPIDDFTRTCTKHNARNRSALVDAAATGHVLAQTGI